MSRMNDVCLRLRLSQLESYLPALTLPESAEGRIYRTIVPAKLLFAEMDLFLFEPKDEGTILDMFPLLMFRTKETSLPQIGDMKEIRLLGLYGNEGKVSLNTYVRGTATVLGVDALRREGH